MAYNNFGCTYTDIVRAFNGAILADFDSTAGANDGATIINGEIALQESILLSELNKSVINVLNFVDGVAAASISGSQYTMTLPILNNGYLKAFKVPYNRTSSTISESYFNACGSNGVKCPTSLLGDIGTAVSVTYVSSFVAQVNETIDLTQYKVYFSYEVDKNSVSIASLKGILRNKVACMLGGQLYAQGADEWKVVTRYCDNAHLPKDFIPPELNALSWFKNPFSNNIGFVKVYR